MSKYTLYYFNITGFGEPCRYLLSYCGVKFEDKRLVLEEWPKYKPDMPMGQIPVLEIDGKKYHQSVAICRFIGKKFNLYGKDEYEALKIDAAVNSIEDLKIAISTWHRQEDEEVRSRLKENTFTKINYLMTKFEEQVNKNGGYFVNGKVSWADVYYSGLCDYFNNAVGYDINKDYSSLKKLNETIKSHPGIKAYIDNRPFTRI